MPIYFYRWHSEQRFKEERRDSYNEHAALLSLMAGNRERADNPELQERLRACRIRIEKAESNLLLHKAHYLGIEYPTKTEKPDWWELDSEESWLSEKGQIRVNRLIKEERQKNIEWWVKVVTPLIGALISLMGLIIALITILRPKV